MDPFPADFGGKHSPEPAPPKTDRFMTDVDPPVDITLPEVPGVYEIRFLDLTDKTVLSGRIIGVE